jgi:hypothetical protein
MQLRYVDYFSRSATFVRLCVSVHWREVAQWLLFVDAMSATILGSHPSTGRQMKPWITKYYWKAYRRRTNKPEQDGQHRIHLV